MDTSLVPVTGEVARDDIVAKSVAIVGCGIDAFVGLTKGLIERQLIRIDMNLLTKS